MPTCVFKHCKNSSQKQKKEDGISFHRFPVDPFIHREWVTILRKSRQDINWYPSKFCVVCSSHFKENDVYYTDTGRRLIKKTSIPTQVLYKSPSSPKTSDDDIDRLRFKVEKANSENDTVALNSYGHNLLPGQSPGTSVVAIESLRCKVEKDYFEDDTAISNSNTFNILPGHSSETSGAAVEIMHFKVEKDDVEDDIAISNSYTFNILPVQSSETSGAADQILHFKVEKDDFQGDAVTSNSCTFNILPGQSLETSNVAIESLRLKVEKDGVTTSNSDALNLLPGPSNEDDPIDPEIRDSDLDSVFDTPVESRLRKMIRKHKLSRAVTRRKIKSLQTQVRRFKKRHSSLKNILKELKQKHFIKFDNNDLLCNNIVATELFHNLYKRSSGKKQLKYSPAMRHFCLTLYSHSTKGYNYVRKVFNNCLPHPRDVVICSKLAKTLDLNKLQKEILG